MMSFRNDNSNDKDDVTNQLDLSHVQGDYFSFLQPIIFMMNVIGRRKEKSLCCTCNTCGMHIIEVYAATKAATAKPSLENKHLLKRT